MTDQFSFHHWPILPTLHWFPHFHSDFWNMNAHFIFIFFFCGGGGLLQEAAGGSWAGRSGGINFNYTCQCQGYRVASGRSDWFAVNRGGGGLVMEVSVATSSRPFITWEAAGIKAAVRDFDLEWELQHTHTCWHNTQSHTIPQLA